MNRPLAGLERQRWRGAISSRNSVIVGSCALAVEPLRVCSSGPNRLRCRYWPVLVSVQLDGDERGTGAIARVPTAEWALASGRVGAAGVSFWATALAVNTIMTLGATPETFSASLDALVHCQPLEASWLVRLRFRLSDRQVRFDPTKYGWRGSQTQ